MADAIPLLQATHAHCACPVCLDVFKDPVCFPCGHVLCRACAVRCIAVRPRCPLCNQAVPNMRHGVALPQLALFCTLARDVGLRVGGRDACRKNSTADGQGSEASSPERKRPCVEEDAEATGLLGGGGGEGERDGEEARVTAASLLSSVQIDPAATSAALPLSAVTPAPVARALRLGISDGDPPHHLPDLLRDAAAETQRLPSDSPPTPHTPSQRPVPSPLLSAMMSASEHGDSDGKYAVPPAPQLDHHASSPSASHPSTTPAEEPVATPLRLLRALAEHVDSELECTPRLPSPPGLTRTCLHSAAGDGEEEDTAGAVHHTAHAPRDAHSATTPDDVASAAAASTVWRLWKRGQGVLHCALTPPAARWQSALHSTAAEVAGGNAGEEHSALSGDARDCPEMLPVPAATVFHRTGCCVLCGLDVVQRSAVRHRLQRLLQSPTAQCDPAELAAQTEDSLTLLLGPLWGLRCDMQSSSPSAATPVASGNGVYTTSPCDASSSTRLVGRRSRCGGGGSASRGVSTCGGLAHHNCLAWSGLLDRFTDTTEEEEEGARQRSGASSAGLLVPTTTTVLHMTVPLQDPFEVLATHASGRIARWQLLAATLWWQQQQQQPSCQPRRSLSTVVEGRVSAAAASPDDREAPARAGTPVADESAGRVLVSPQCALCGGAASTSPMRSDTPSAAVAPFGAGLRACEGTERGESSCGRQFHYPCALLAGAAACIVFGLEDERNVVGSGGNTVTAAGACVRDCDAAGGKPSDVGLPVEVWCGTCHARHEARRRHHE